MMKCIVDKLRKQHRLSSDEYRALLTMRNPQDVDYLMTQAREVAQQQFDMDDYLDKVNVIRKKVERITDETNNLVETVRDHFTEFDEQETTELLAHSTPILILMDQLHQKLIYSPLYPGLETVVENYLDCVSDFQELCTDLQVWNIDVPRNSEVLEAERKLTEMLKG